MIIVCHYKKYSTFVAPGEMAEWSIAAVLKTVELRGSGGSNPSLSAKIHQIFLVDFLMKIAVHNFSKSNNFDKNIVVAKVDLLGNLECIIIFAVAKNKHGCSSVGRALVSKTRCREFESLLPCKPERQKKWGFNNIEIPLFL